MGIGRDRSLEGEHERQNNRESETERGSRSQTDVSASVVHIDLLVTLEGLESLEEEMLGESLGRLSFLV